MSNNRQVVDLKLYGKPSVKQLCYGLSDVWRDGKKQSWHKEQNCLTNRLFGFRCFT